MSTSYLHFSFYLFFSGFLGIIWAMIFMLSKLQKADSTELEPFLPAPKPTLKASKKIAKTIILNPEHPFIKKLDKVILSRFDDENLTILQVCNELHLSHTQVYRKIKKLTGQTPSQYIRSFRLDHAQSLLRTTNLNISEVAFLVGFKELSYFSKVFHKEYGISPSLMRKAA